MAAYPCQIGMHRYSGAQRSMYITRVGNGSLHSRKLRLCLHHFGQLLETVQEHGVDVAEEQTSITRCRMDGCGVEPHDTVLVKVYDQGEDPVEYAIDMCEPHAGVVLELLGWNGAISL